MNESNLEKRIRDEYSAAGDDIQPPPVHVIRARQQLVKPARRNTDPFLLIASFLNMRVKLYHAVIAFFLIWITVLLLSDGNDAAPREQAAYSGPSPLAVYESTVPACINTFIER